MTKEIEKALVKIANSINSEFDSEPALSFTEQYRIESSNIGSALWEIADQLKIIRELMEEKQ